MPKDCQLLSYLHLFLFVVAYFFFDCKAEPYNYHFLYIIHKKYSASNKNQFPNASIPSVGSGFSQLCWK